MKSSAFFVAQTEGLGKRVGIYFIRCMLHFTGLWSGKKSSESPPKIILQAYNIVFI